MPKTALTRNSTRKAVILLKTVCIALLLSLAFAPVGHPQAMRSAPISGRVLQDAAASGAADFLVVFTDQPGGALAQRRFSSRLEQGQVVFETLQASAASSQQALLNQLRQDGIPVQPFWIVNSLALRGSASLIQAIAQRPEVAYIASNAPFRVALEEPQPVPSPSAVNAGVEWNLDWVHAPQVWAMGATGQGIVYANADTGVQWDHLALKGQYRGWDGSTANHDYNWHDAITSASITGNPPNLCGYDLQAPCDDGGHGTHTMGIGVGNNTGGTSIGMAPGAKWISCRNMDGGVGRPSTYLDCFEFFLAPTKLDGSSPDPSRRPDVVGNSYACPLDEQCIDLRVMQAAAVSLRAAGIFMSVSAGNDGGQGCSSINTPPSIEPGFFTVGSTSFKTNAISGFSSRGPVQVNGGTWLKPDLVAPGGAINSSFYNADTHIYSYASLSGTSMASPMVAGAVALLWSARPDLHRDIAGTEAVLRLSALHLPAASGSAPLCGGDLGDSVPNNTYGYGELDVLAAVNFNPFYRYWPYITK